MTTATTDLYGGALTAALPADWIDASDVRPVPDNQEVCERHGLHSSGPQCDSTLHDWTVLFTGGGRCGWSVAVRSVR